MIESEASPIRGILFDKDGTLIDFRATWLPAYEDIVGELAGQDEALCEQMLSQGGYDRATGRLDPTSVLAAGTNIEIATLWAGLAGRTDIATLALDVNRRFMHHARTSIVPVTDLPRLFERLHRRGLSLGVATNDSEMALTAQLDQLGIAGLVDFACGFDSGHGAKPSPGMVEAFAARTGLPISAIAVVGDSLHDLEMARLAGAGLAVGVLTGASPRETLAPHAHHVLNSIVDLEALLSEPP